MLRTLNGLVARSLCAAGAFILALAAAAPPARAGEPCEPAWGPAFGVHGVNGQVNDLAVFDDGSGPALYVAGEFSVAGSIVAPAIAKWTGSQWVALPGPPTYTVGTEPRTGHYNALCVFDDGAGPALYVGGRFTAIGVVAANRVARWDGASWSALGAGVGSLTTGEVKALAVHDDGAGTALYVGGAFGSAGGATARSVARWSGSAWSALGAGIVVSGTEDGVVSLVSADLGQGPRLYAGGEYFFEPGTGLMAWNGATWADVGVLPFGVSPSFSCSVPELAVFDDGTGPALYASGNFRVMTPAGEVQNAARYDGSGWEAVPPGGPTESTQWLATLDDGSGPALYRADALPNEIQVRRWNGVTSSLLTTIARDAPLVTFEAGAAFGGSLFFAGEFTRADSAFVTNIVRYGAGAAQPLADAPANGFASPPLALASFDDGSGPVLFAGGAFVGGAGGPATGPLAQWEGGSWAAAGPPLRMSATEFGDVAAMTVFDNGAGPALYIGGLFNSPAQSVARWDGASLTAVGAGMAGSTINCLASYDDGSGAALYAGGGTVSPGGIRFARFVGSEWETILAAIPTAGTVNEMAVFDDGSGPQLYFGGSFTSVSGMAGTARIARWNGTALSGVAGGFSGGQVRGMTVHDDGTGPALYIGGSVDIPGVGNGVSVARYRGGAWVNMGLTVNRSVSALLTFDDGDGPALYAGGTFDPTVAGAPPTSLAKWNGAAWSAVGPADPLYSTPDAGEAVVALAAHEGAEGPELWVGGFISVADGKAAVNIARLTGCRLSCPGDANGDGLVNFADLNIVLSQFGQSGAPGALSGDVNNDGFVNFADLNIVLGNFGAVC